MCRVRRNQTIKFVLKMHMCGLRTGCENVPVNFYSKMCVYDYCCYIIPFYRSYRNVTQCITCTGT